MLEARLPRRSGRGSQGENKSPGSSEQWDHSTSLSQGQVTGTQARGTPAEWRGDWSCN